MGSAFDISTLDACFGESPDPVAIHDRDGAFVYTNARAEALYGRTRRELWGRSARALDLAPALVQALEPHHAAVVERGETRTFELRHESTGRWYEHRLTPMRDREGRVAAVSDVGREITERKHVEQEASELRALADAMPSMVWMMDADGATTFMSRHWEAYVGEPAVAPDPARWQRRVPVEDLVALRAVWERCRETGAPGVGRMRIQRADGELRWHLARIVPLARGVPARAGDRATITGWVGTATEVHDELRAKAEADAILGAAPIGIATYDRSLARTSANEAMRALDGTGAEREDGGARAEESPRERELRTILARVLETGEPVRSHALASASGERVLHAFPVRIEGRVSGVCAIEIDVGELGRMERSLRDALQRLELHVDNSPLGVIEWDRDFRVTSWSRGAEALFGWTASEVIGKHPDEWPFVHAEDAEEVRRSIAQRLSGAEPRQIGQARYHRKDGSIVHTEWYDSALTSPQVASAGEPTSAAAAGEAREVGAAGTEGGPAVSVLSLVLDVTSRVRAREADEQRLRAEKAARAHAELERARFHRLLLHAPALVAILRGPDHVYEFLNERFCETIPEARRLVGTSARKHRADLVEEHFLDLLDQVYRTGEAYEAPEVPLVVYRDGAPETLYLTFVYQPIRASDGTVEGIASFAFDVSESVLARKQVEEASRAKDEFLSTLSHELRTPLNAIVGWSHLLRTGALEGAQVQRALEAIDRNAKVQKRLIDDLLDFARMVSGKLGLAASALDLSSIVSAAAESVRGSVEAKNVRLSVLPKGRPVIVGDADRLHQVVCNLLSNAVKFTGPRGHIQVTVRAHAGHAEIEVRDDGLGIDPAFLPFVFERFRQADSSMTRRHGGLGLGLAIARSIVEMHGGSIVADSPGLGRGTTMRVTLPRAAEGAVLPPPAGRLVPPALATLAGVRVLVVDDEEDARGLVGTVLEKSGAEVRLAGSAAEALEALHDDDHDVLVSDIGMPELDGITLIQRVRAMPSPTCRIPAIAVTAYARPEDRSRAVGAGYDGFLSKPLDVDELAATVARAVGRLA